MYTLDDVRARSLTTPTFQVPTVQEIAEHTQKPGAYVKLCFSEEGEMTERMWVSVITYDPKTEVGLGTLDNDPHGLETVKHGDTVEFRGHHVCGLC
jgi:uncharacterized protein YegJ (DUF2314 family)